MKTVPPAEQIEIVRAEDLPPLFRPLPDATPLSELSLTTRSRGMLKGYHRYDLPSSRDDWGMRVVLTTVGDLRRESDASLLRQDNFGRKSLMELREACGDAFPFAYTPRYERQTLTQALGEDRARIIIAMRAVAGQLNWLADLIETAARKGSL